MKKFTLFTALIMSAVLIFSGSKAEAQELYPRMLMAEMFYGANTSASPELFNGQAVNKVYSYPEIFIPIKFYRNWPEGEDEVYNSNVEMNDARYNFYGVKSIPRFAYNGKLIEGSIKSSFFTDSIAQYAKGLLVSPYKITVSHKVEGEIVKATIKVKSSIPAQNKKLQIAMLEYSYVYQAGSGETDHNFIARDMHQNSNGIDFSLTAGEEKTFEVTFPKKTYNEAELYIAAWMHDKNSKDIEQAGSNFNEVKHGATISTVDNNNYITVEKKGTTEITLNVKNFNKQPGTFKVVEYFGVHQDKDNFEITFVPETVTLAPGETKQITAKITNKGKSNFSISYIKTHLTTPGIDVSEVMLLHTMTKNPKHAIYCNYQNLPQAKQAYEWLSTFRESRNDLVLVPVLEDKLFTKFDVSTIKTAAYIFDAFNKEMLASSVLPDQIMNILNNDSRVLLINQFGFSQLYVLNPDISVNANWRTIIRSKLNITKMHLNQAFVADSQSVAFIRYKVKGIENDIITGNTGSLAANNITQQDQVPYASVSVEEIEIDDTQFASKPILEYEAPFENYAGVRKEFAKGKLVFLSFPVSSLDSDQERNTLLENIYTWLIDDTSDEAKMIVTGHNHNSLGFDDVKLGESETKTITIENKGRKTLEITDIVYEGSKVFSIANLSYPYNLSMGEKVDIAITFTPNQKNKDFEGKMIIKSNAYMMDNFDISISGRCIGDIAAPVPTLSATEVNFGEVKVKTASTKKVTLSNKGDAPFTTEAIIINNDDNAVYEIAEVVDIPFTLEPNAKKELNIKFESFSLGTFNAQAEISTDDKNNPKLTIDLTGTAVDDSKVADEVGNDNFSIRTMPNPMTTSGSILVKAGNAINVEMQLVDANGKIIDNLFSSSNFIGESSIKLNVEALSNGLFFVKANVDGQVYSLPVLIKK